jgi:hypothetical protein
MPYDYTNAPPPRDIELIPHGTIATVFLHILAGNVGEDGMLTRSQKGDCEMLDIELSIIDGPYKGRKIWAYWVLDGITPGHAKAADINRGTIKAILDSALGLKPNDTSPEARSARTRSLRQLEGLTFIAKIGIEKGNAKADGSGNWPDKNILAVVITPDMKEWHPVEQPPPFDGGNSGGATAAAPSGSAPPIARPAWAGTT